MESGGARGSKPNTGNNPGNPNAPGYGTGGTSPHGPGRKPDAPGRSTIQDSSTGRDLTDQSGNSSLGNGSGRDRDHQGYGSAGTDKNDHEAGSRNWPGNPNALGYEVDGNSPLGPNGDFLTDTTSAEINVRLAELVDRGHEAVKKFATDRSLEFLSAAVDFSVGILAANKLSQMGKPSTFENGLLTLPQSRIQAGRLAIDMFGVEVVDLSVFSGIFQAADVDTSSKGADGEWFKASFGDYIKELAEDDPNGKSSYRGSYDFKDGLIGNHGVEVKGVYGASGNTITIDYSVRSSSGLDRFDLNLNPDRSKTGNIAGHIWTTLYGTATVFPMTVVTGSILGTTEISKPILLDLDGDGIQINELSRSTVFVDAGGDGLLHRSAWAGGGDGVLFYDAGNDGKITEKREYVFTEWDPTAKGDLEALRTKFDSNGDGSLTRSPAAAFHLPTLYPKPQRRLREERLAGHQKARKSHPEQALEQISA